MQSPLNGHMAAKDTIVWRCSLLLHQLTLLQVWMMRELHLRMKMLFLLCRYCHCRWSFCELPDNRHSEFGLFLHASLQRLQPPRQHYKPVNHGRDGADQGAEGVERDLDQPAGAASNDCRTGAQLASLDLGKNVAAIPVLNPRQRWAQVATFLRV